MALMWFDADAVSIVNLDGTDPTKPETMYAVPRLAVYRLPNSTWWGTYCVESNSLIPEMAPYWPTREEAKRRIIEFALKVLPNRWQSALQSIRS